MEQCCNGEQKQDMTLITEPLNRTGISVRLSERTKRRRKLTGVRKDSATNRARAFSYLGQSLRLKNLRSNTHEKFHFRNFLVHLLHKLDNEVDKLVLQHRLGMEVGNEEGDIVALNTTPSEPNV